MTGESWINDSLVREATRQAGDRPSSPVVHTVHTEVEGLSRAALFADLLDRLLAEGARFTRLDEIAARQSDLTRGTATPGAATPCSATTGTATTGTAAPGMAIPGTATPGAAISGTATPGAATPAATAHRETLPVCEVRDGVLPGRSGFLAVQVIE